MVGPRAAALPAALGQKEGILPLEVGEVYDILQGKTAERLDKLKIQIKKTINSKAEGIDIGSWEAVLSLTKRYA